MPDNGVEEGICNLYELDDTFQGQRLSQTVGGNWPVLDYNQWVGKPRQSGANLNFNLKDYNLQQLDSVKGHDNESLRVPFNQNYMQLTPSPEFSRSLTRNNLLNINEFLLGRQNFQSRQNQPESFSESTCYDQRLLTLRGVSIVKSQQENECADSPTLTTNSERSEITEASSDFNFLIGQHQFAGDQQLSSPLPYQMQQPGYNDMQLLQQHVLFKQLQEFQRQQQLQQLGDLRQQNSLNQFSAISRQAAGGQFSPLINGTPVPDGSQMLRNWMQRGASPAAQGTSNKVAFSQEQSQALRSMGLTPQQLDASLYGTPVSNTRGNMNQYPHLQGLSHDSVNLLAKASGQAQKSIMQSSGFGNPYLGDQFAVPLDLAGLPQGALVSKQELQMKNNFGQFPVQGLNGGLFPGTLQEGNITQANTTVKEFDGREEQTGWPAMQRSKQLGPSQSLVPLDPMEAKILYNMDDNIWDAFGSRSDTGASLNNMLEHADSSNAFPSIQSGSWSALMQSAVAEASSSDTGLHEEWSGLTFQNTEHSNDNQISNFVESEKQQTGWVDNNLQSASSFNSNPFPMITDSNMSSSFPGFQQPGIQLSIEQREDICQDGSHESTGNCKSQQKSSMGDGQKVQTFIPSDKSWAGQTFEHSQSTLQHQKVTLSDVSIDNKGSESMFKSHQQMNNVPRVALSTYEGTNEKHEKQQTSHEGENSNDCSKGSSGHDLGHLEQFKFFGNVSRSAVNVDKTSFPDFQGNSRASEEVPSGGDQGSNTSATFHGSILPDGSNVSAQSSEHMLELLHKVDQSKDDSTIKQFGSNDNDPLAEVPRADSHEASGSQLHAQSSASQGFGLRLAPSSQGMPNLNNFLIHPGLPQTISNLNSRHINPELGDKNQAWLTSSSFQSSPPPHELAQRSHWDNKTGTPGHKSFSPYVNMLGNSVASFASNTQQTRNQLQMHPLSNVPVSSLSSQATLPGAASGFPSFNQAPTQDISQQIQTNPVSQQFPVLEASPLSQPSITSGISQQGESSARPYNVWRNVPTQRQPFVMEPLKIPNFPSSMDQTNNSVSTSGTSCGLNDHNSIKGGYKSSETGSSNSQGFDHGREHPGKEMLQQHMPSKILDASCSGGASQGQQPVSDVTALTSGSLVSHAQQQDLDQVRPSKNLAQAPTERNHESLSHSYNDHHNYSLLHQVQAMNNGAESTPDVQHAAALGGWQLHDNISRFKYSTDGRPNPTSQPNSFPSGNTQMLRFLAEARGGPIVKAPQTGVQSRPSQEIVTFGYNDSHTQSSSGNVLSNHTDHGQVNMRMAPSWFKQYGALRNGQMVPIFDARLAKTAASQFSLGKPTHNLHIHTPLEQLDAADAGQGGNVWQSSAAALVASQQLSSPYMLPSEVTNQGAVMRSKKRKFETFELLPWHKEVTQDSKRPQNISVAEHDWAQATNRVIEKVQDEVEMIEDVQPVNRSKRRLILTTRLLQQLFRPAPASVLYADSVSNYGIISYFVSRLSLGDACSLAYCMRNDFLAPVNNSNVNSENLKISESCDQQLLAVVEEFIDRAKKLENDFQRLDKTASVVDVRAEFMDLERFAVINRFAKFHVRGQLDASATSPSSVMQKPNPQRHIAVFPMPRNLPEGVQCLSL